MKITHARVTPVAVYDPPLRNSTGVHQPYAIRTIVQLFTDDGLTGAGEAHGGHELLAALEATGSRLGGHDPYQLERLWQAAPTPAAYAPFEVACLDIIGQHTGRPVCDLLGGRVRDRVTFAAYLFFKYARDDGRDSWGEVLTPEAMVAEARRFVETWGFPVLKLKGGVLPPDDEIETMQRLRAAFPHHGLRLDPNAIWSVETSIRVGKALEPVGLEYLEDPTVGQAGMAAVRQQVQVPLSTNMCVTAWAHMTEGFRVGCVDVVLADPHYWGGLHATKHLGVVCQALGWGLSMHSNNHLGISLAAMLHAAAATPHLTYACDTHYPWQDEDVVKGTPFRFVDGALAVPTRPGLGVEVDEERLAARHEQYRRAAIAQRDDVTEMRKYDPTWEPKRPRW